MSRSRHGRPNPGLEPHKEAEAWLAKQHSRERRKIVGLLMIVLLILALAFARFWKTIPWGAR